MKKKRLIWAADTGGTPAVKSALTAMAPESVMASDMATSPVAAKDLIFTFAEV